MYLDYWITQSASQALFCGGTGELYVSLFVLLCLAKSVYLELLYILQTDIRGMILILLQRANPPEQW